MQPADRAWLTLAVGVIAWDVTCCEGDTLSEACDRYMLHHPWIVRGLAFALAAHVCNLVPPRFDVIHGSFVAIRTTRRR
jgi:hypothetical protein